MCSDYDTYSAATVILPFLLNIIQTHQHAPSEDHLVDGDIAMQAYHTMNQLFGEPANRYRVRMEYEIKVMKDLV